MARPLTLSPRGALAVLAALTLLRLIVAAVTPLAPDEAYYWVWSRALAPGYLDHPPMVALWIRAGTLLAGPTPLGIRLLAPLATALGSILLWQAARDLLGDRDQATRAAALLNATLLFGAGAVTMTPDTPLLFFWTLALWAMARLAATGRGPWWLAAAAACGLAFDSKYTAVLLPAGIALWLAWTRQWRWLARPVLWLAAALGLAITAPVLWWNAAHHWASFAKQGGRGLVFDPSRLASHLAELIAGQAGLATPLLFILCIAGLIAATRLAMRDRAPAATLLVCLSLPPIALFLEHALGDRVQANWPAIIYPALAIAACLAAPRLQRALLVPGIALGAVLTLTVYLQSATALLPLPPKLDPTSRLAGYADLAQAVHTAAVQHGARFIAADEYGAASLLALLSPGCTPIVAIEPRWRLFDLPPAGPIISGQPGLLLRTTHRRQPPDRDDWSSLAPLTTLTRARKTQPIETYTLYAGTARAGAEAAVILPCPSG